MFKVESSYIHYMNDYDNFYMFTPANTKFLEILPFVTSSYGSQTSTPLQKALRLIFNIKLTKQYF